MSRHLNLHVHRVLRHTKNHPLISASAINPRKFVPSSVTIPSLYCFTALICLTPATLQSRMPPLLSRLLIAIYRFLTFSCSHTLAPWLNRIKPSDFFVCDWFTPVCTVLYDSNVRLLLRHTHLPRSLYTPMFFASCTVQASISLYCFLSSTHSVTLWPHI